MFVENPLYGGFIERALIPKTVGLALYLLRIEVGQNLFQFIHHAVRRAVAEHFQQMNLYWIETGSCGYHLNFNFAAKIQQIFHMAKYLFYYACHLLPFLQGELSDRGAIVAPALAGQGIGHAFGAQQVHLIVESARPHDMSSVEMV